MFRPHDTIVCVASGPSFSSEQAAAIEQARSHERCRVVAINDSYRRLPSADILYACDGKWWDVHLERVKASGFGGELWTQDARAAQRYALNLVKGRARPGLCKDPGTIHTGGNSGYQAIGLAYHLGARRTVLVGYDMQKTNGATHWFGEHAKPLSNAHPYSAWLANFKVLAEDLKEAGVEVVNASLQTALLCFPRADLVEALA